MEIKSLESQLPRPYPGALDSWKHPPSNVAKVNFDASYVGKKKKSWSGIIIRNGLGQILGSCSTIHHHVALAHVSGLHFAFNMGFHSIIFEGDARSIIVKLQDNSNVISVISPLISDGKSLARQFEYCSFRFTNKFTNKAAHAMTRERLFFLYDRFWVEEAPSTVMAIVKEDCKDIKHP
ncbi:hypothetical protein V6N11_018309 [Hibiscus sabdariffa]|uniref:RNase H type-1 domain-containing protein n=2 Tax=Hibiscus sabdariffa TaxID=183260 RepID=A0ABR2T7H0_9ROSI